ncbi:MAG: hypothetical protein ACOVOR_05580 [Rhabdochlamydiaceae bacterium]
MSIPNNTSQNHAPRDPRNPRPSPLHFKPNSFSTIDAKRIFEDLSDIIEQSNHQSSTLWQHKIDLLYIKYLLDRNEPMIKSLEKTQKTFFGKLWFLFTKDHLLIQDFKKTKSYIERALSSCAYKKEQNLAESLFSFEFSHLNNLNSLSQKDILELCHFLNKTEILSKTSEMQKNDPSLFSHVIFQKHQIFSLACNRLKEWASFAKLELLNKNFDPALLPDLQAIHKSFIDISFYFKDQVQDKETRKALSQIEATLNRLKPLALYKSPKNSIFNKPVIQTSTTIFNPAFDTFEDKSEQTVNNMIKNMLDYIEAHKEHLTQIDLSDFKFLPKGLEGKIKDLLGPDSKVKIISTLYEGSLESNPASKMMIKTMRHNILDFNSFENRGANGALKKFLKKEDKLNLFVAFHPKHPEKGLIKFIQHTGVLDTSLIDDTPHLGIETELSPELKIFVESFGKQAAAQYILQHIDKSLIHTVILSPSFQDISPSEFSNVKFFFKEIPADLGSWGFNEITHIAIKRFKETLYSLPYIEELNFSGSYIAWPELYTFLKNTPNLKSLNLNDCNRLSESNDDLSYFRLNEESFPNLIILKSTNSHLHNQRLLSILERSPKLGSLTLSNFGSDQEVVNRVCSLSELRGLSLSISNRDASVVPSSLISSIPTVQYLEVSSLSFQQLVGLVNLFPNLEFLSIKNLGAHPAVMPILGQHQIIDPLTHLKNISFGGDVSINTLRYMTSKAPHLTTLDITNIGLQESPESLKEFLLDFPHLNNLDLLVSEKNGTCRLSSFSCYMIDKALFSPYLVGEEKFTLFRSRISNESIQDFFDTNKYNPFGKLNLWQCKNSKGDPLPDLELRNEADWNSLRDHDDQKLMDEIE